MNATTTSIITSNLPTAFYFALASTAALVISHSLCVGIVMYYDLTGKWDAYKLHKTRKVSVQDYVKGLKNFVKDLILLFIPFMTFCYCFRVQQIQGVCVCAACVLRRASK
jgi:hypothetical protein